VGFDMLAAVVADGLLGLGFIDRLAAVGILNNRLLPLGRVLILG
jgi:hypothetical protein